MGSDTVPLSTEALLRTLALALALALLEPLTAGAACRFHYTDEIRLSVVGPELAKRIGDEKAKFFAFDDNRPVVVSRHGDRVALSFMSNNVSLSDPPDFEVLLSQCGQRLVGSRLGWSPGTGITGEWISPAEAWPSDEWARTRGREHL
jgi:hypothetical protein